ncbi:MAG: DUF3754 domain-containing protein [Armatimonadetes bacterium]|nr:DUF3754 domain-containing protein [Armatimonadota bacterium]
MHRGREHFIPISRLELVDLCTGSLEPEERGPFRAFCELVSASVHFRFHRRLENLKRAYRAHDPEFPDAPPAVEDPLPELEDLLRQANFSRLPDCDLQRALREESVVPLRTRVDFADFDRVLVYYQNRGRIRMASGLEVDGFGRVLLALKFRGPEHFGARSVERGCLPGKTCIYLYRDVPAADLELLFPNVKVGMRARDLAGILTPAALGLVLSGPTLLPQLDVVFRAVSAGQPEAASGLLLALLSLVLTVTGVTAKQTLTYKNRRLEFLRCIGELLFFHKLDCNRGVLHSLMDAAEEEESKEMILLYYHLLSRPQGIGRRQADHEVEQWLAGRGLDVDFDIAKALDSWKKLSPAVIDARGGRLQAAPISEALRYLDRAWDLAFEYA